MKTAPSIFISYCWDDEKFVNIIDAFLTSYGIILTRDVRDIAPYSSIESFMTKIRKVDFTIIVITKNYMKSVNCMREIVELLKIDDYSNKTIPIVINEESFNFYKKSDTILTFIKYWDEQYKGHVNAAINIEPSAREYIDKNAKIFAHIRDSIGEFIECICDKNSPSFEKLFETNFKVILDFVGINEYHQNLITELTEISKIVDENSRNSEFENIISNNKNSYLVYLFRGNFEHLQKKHAEAIKFCTESINLNPYYALSYNIRGVEYGFIDKHEEAINDFAMAILIKPEYTDSYFNRGNSYFKIGTKKLNDAVKNNAGLNFDRSDFDLAISDYTNAIDIDSNNAFYYAQRGRAILVKEDWVSGIADLSKAIGLNSEIAEFYLYRAIAYSSIGRWDNYRDDLTNYNRLKKWAKGPESD